MPIWHLSLLLILPNTSTSHRLAHRHFSNCLSSMHCSQIALMRSFTGSHMHSHAGRGDSGICAPRSHPNLIPPTPLPLTVKQKLSTNHVELKIKNKTKTHHGFGQGAGLLPCPNPPQSTIKTSFLSVSQLLKHHRRARPHTLEKLNIKHTCELF